MAILLRFDIAITAILLLIASALLLSQHWGMLFSNSDDPWIIRSTWEQIHKTASDQGRFWLIPIMYLAGLPYKLGGWELGNAAKILVNGLTLLTFTAFLARLVNIRFALTTTLTWLALLDVSNGYYSPFHGFPLMFNLQMGALFLSLWWYLKLLDKGMKGATFTGPYLLFGFSLLAYESMLFFSATYYAVALFRHLTQDGAAPSERTMGSNIVALVRWSVSWTQNNWPLLAVILAYIAAYFGYRHFLPAAGRGIDFGGELADIIKTIYRFSIHGFHFELSLLAKYVEGVTSRATLLWAMTYAALLALAGLLIIPSTDQDPREAALRHPVSLAIIAFFVFSPNVLHGFVEMYRQWAADSPHYVGNYLSSFALAILISNGIIALVGGIKARQEWMLFAVVIYVLASSAADNMLSWHKLAETNRKDGKLWALAINDLKERPLPRQIEPIHVCAKNSPEKVSGDDAFWSYQLGLELNQQVTYRSKRLNSILCDITIDFNQYRFPAR